METGRTERSFTQQSFQAAAAEQQQQQQQQSFQGFPNFPATANYFLLMIPISTLEPLLPLTLTDDFAFKSFTIEVQPLAIDPKAKS